MVLSFMQTCNPFLCLGTNANGSHAADQRVAGPLAAPQEADFLE